jgi:hypothetical protein
MWGSIVSIRLLCQKFSDEQIRSEFNLNHEEENCRKRRARTETSIEEQSDDPFKPEKDLQMDASGIRNCDGL